MLVSMLFYRLLTVQYRVAREGWQIGRKSANWATFGSRWHPQVWLTANFLVLKHRLSLCAICYGCVNIGFDD